jgi:hypothetical protein
MNLDDFEGHTPIWYLYGEVGAWWVQSDFTTHDDFIVAEVRSQNEVDAKLIAAAPDLLAFCIWMEKYNPEAVQEYVTANNLQWKGYE